jgi:serine/threonine protein kinase
VDRIRESPSALSEPASVCVSCEQPCTEARCKNCGAALRAGRFRILRVLHQGAHGRMYLARDDAGKRVALKEILFALVPDVQQLAAFEREAALLRQLRHPRIPRFIASFQEGKGISTRLYLAQEFIEGTALHAQLEQGPLPEAELQELARRVLLILGYLHTL